MTATRGSLGFVFAVALIDVIGFGIVMPALLASLLAFAAQRTSE